MQLHDIFVWAGMLVVCMLSGVFILALASVPYWIAYIVVAGVFPIERKQA